MENIVVNIDIPFATEHLATIAYNVLIVDEEPPRSKVTKTLSVQDKLLKVEFQALLAKQVRVAVTSFFENLNLIIDTINFTGPPAHTRYSYP